MDGLMSETDPLEAATRRLALALEGLEAATERRREADRAKSALAEHVHALGSDRARLASELDEATARAHALEAANREVARRLAAKSPVIMKIGRDAFMRAVDADFRRSVENAAESFALIATTNDCQEGLNAFVEKRKPIWKGR